MDKKYGKGKSLTWFIGRPKTSGFIAFLLLFVVVLFILHQRYSLIIENDKREMSNLLNVVYNNLDQSLKNASNSALTLALTLNDEGQSPHFDIVAQKLLESNPGIDAVQLVPGGIIEKTYPFEGNESAIGLNILKDPYLKEEAYESINRRKMYFAGPLKLKQGGIGVVGRLPIYKEDKFWGFSAVIIKLETFLKNSGIQSINDSKYYFQLSMTDKIGEQVFLLHNKDDFSEKYYDSLKFSDSTWQLYIITKNQNDVYFEVLPLALIGTIFAMLCGLLIQLLLKKPAQLKKLVAQQAEKLLVNEIKYKSMFTLAAIGIANVDTYTGRFLDINEPFCHILGYSKDEMMARTFMDLTHADDMSENMTLLEQLREGTIEKFSFEKRYFTKSGNIVWVNITVSPLWEPGEVATTHMTIAEDITLKKEAKEAIAKSEVRFKSLFDDSPIALWEEDFSEVKKFISSLDIVLDGKNIADWFRANPAIVDQCVSRIKVIDVNNECLKLHRPKTKADLLSNLQLVLDQHSSEVYIKQFAAIYDKEMQFSTESRVLLSDGDMRDISFRWTVMPSFEDSLERVIISTEDITVMKEAQKLMLNSRQRLENLVNTIDGIVWECDAETFELHFISQKTLSILGYTVEEWSSDVDFWQKHMHPDDHDKAFCTFLEIVKHLVESDFEYRMIAKDGSVVWIRDMITSLEEDGKTILRGIMIDITANKAAEQDLKTSFELVTEQKKRLMNFSFIVSHNLRSHAANIQSITSFIECADSDEDRQEMVGMLKTVSGSLNETLLNLNDVINIQANVSLVSEPLSLASYINNTVNLLSKEITTKKAIVHNNVSNVTIEYNPAYLESVLLNLISNAIKYCKPNIPPIVTIDYEEIDGKKVIKIADNGLGIDLKKHGDKIFGLYKTFNGNTDARGIGLFMTRTQIEAMGGKIFVDSELGKGTTFTVYLR